MRFILTALKRPPRSADREGVDLVRDSRTYLAGLGTTAILVLGAAVVLLTVSTLFAFSGWGPSDTGSNVDDLVLEDGRGTSGLGALAAGAARSAAAAAAPPAAGGGAGDGASGGASDGTGRTLAGNGPGLGGGGDAPSPDGSVGPGPRPTPRTSAPPTTTRGGDPAAPNGLGDATKGLTQDLGQAVEPVSPELGQTIGDTGGTLGGAVGVVAPRL